MTNIESIKKSKRIGKTTITFVLTFCVAAFAASGVSYGAKPFPATALSPTVCSKIFGVWTTNACTIPAGIDGVAKQPFTVSNGVTLDVKGSLTINSGITVAVANSGTMIVENAGGVTQSQFDDWKTGVLVYGTLANSGTITIANVYDGSVRTVGISVWASATDFNDLSTYVYGTLTNSGRIDIQNSGETRGIENLGTITNSASGTITVANSGDSNYCVGIDNKRFDAPDGSIQATLTNAGTLTISTSGDNTYGIFSYGFLTNSGLLTVDSLSGAATGIYNGGSFTQTTTGTYYNNHGYIDYEDTFSSVWGNYNTNGTMINYGTTYVNGTFLTLGYTMINYGTIYSTSTGAMIEYGGSMLNYGTIYNYGIIYGGKNYGTCIDEPPTGSGC